MPLNLPPPKSNGAAVALAPPVQSSAVRSASPSETTPLPEASTSSGTTFPTRSGGLSLPPPKTKSKQAAGGPKKFVLDLPKPSSSRSADGEDDDDDEPAAKKPRMEGGSGLRGLLPEPKKKAQLSALLASTPAGQAGSTAQQGTTSLLPHRLQGKGKGKATGSVNGDSEGSLAKAEGCEDVAGQGNASGAPPEAAPEVDFFGLASTSTEPVVDFFGLGGGSATASTSIANSITTPSTTSTSKFSAAPSSTTVKTPKPAETAVSKPKFSAAPTTSAPDLASNYYATLPVPTANDPYPGFYQKPDKTWAAKRPDEWEIWINAHNYGKEARQEEKKEPQLPADFDASALEDSIDVRADKLRGTGEFAGIPRPGKVPEEERKRQEEEKLKQERQKKKQNYVAKSRNQLSTLIANAKDNRQELEDRIAQMKNNKRTGGSKYGF